MYIQITDGLLYAFIVTDAFNNIAIFVLSSFCPFDKDKHNCNVYKHLISQTLKNVYYMKFECFHNKNCKNCEMYLMSQELYVVIGHVWSPAILHNPLLLSFLVMSNLFLRFLIYQL